MAEPNDWAQFLARCCLLACLLFAPTVATAGASASHDPEPDEEIVYKRVGDVELKLHRFNPPAHDAADKSPAIIFFFGGGWQGGKASQFHPQCRYLASRGMVAFTADYRVQSRNHTSPKECVMDAKSALRWLRKHAAELGIDTQKIAAGGGSAGGHLAAAAATLAGFNEEGDDTSVDCRPNALVLFNPVIDNGPGGYGYDRVKDYWESFSPMNNLGPDTPPTIIFLGTQDDIVPVATARKFQQLMKNNGRVCELHLYEGQRHGFFNQDHPRYYAETLAAADKFLASLGYLSGPPTQ